MPKVCLYFQLHQPLRIKKYRIFDIGRDNNYFNDDSDTNLNNRKIFEKVALKCYLPANEILLNLLKKNKHFKISFSLSGIFLMQAMEFMPSVIDSFKELIETGQVELLNETFYHSLSYVYSVPEFRRQVQMHRNLIKSIFNVTPSIFRNTELIFNNDLAYEVEGLGFSGILAEGADRILGWRSPNYLYRAKEIKKIKVLLKNYKLSDDIAFRFSEKTWSEYPLTADKFAAWIGTQEGDLVNLFMDYETFGEHQWEDSGIFEFLKHLPAKLQKYDSKIFITPSEAVEKFKTVGDIDISDFVSWADTERDLSAWISNPMQQDAAKKLYEIENMVLETEDKKLIEDWRRLTTSDHFYYMCTKYFSDGDVHKYFNPYESPYEAFISFMNVLTDLKLRIQNKHRVNQVDANTIAKELKDA